MGFVQIIEFRTSKFEEGRRLVEEYRNATAGRNTARSAVTARDRNDADHYFNLVFFDSYESAMENSKLPETQELSSKLAGLSDGPPTFYDLDIVERVEM